MTFFKSRLREWLKDFIFPPAPSPAIVLRQSEHVVLGQDALLLDSVGLRIDAPKREITPCVMAGRGSVLGCNFVFESDTGFVEIGDRCYIGPGTNLISRSSIIIRNDVVIAWGCYLYDHNSHSLDAVERVNDIVQFVSDYKESGNGALRKDWTTVDTKPIVINDNVWIGFESVILKGVTIGEGAIVGARSVVTKDVAPWTVVAGNPAREVKKLKR